jgi:hypothetical protein
MSIGVRAFCSFEKKDTSRSVKARFKTAQLLPKWLFVGWSFEKIFNQSLAGQNLPKNGSSPACVVQLFVSRKSCDVIDFGLPPFSSANGG